LYIHDIPDDASALRSCGAHMLRRLHSLARRGDVEQIRALLHQVEVDVDAPDRQGLTALFHAIDSEAAGVEVVRVLLEHGARLDVEQAPADGSRRFALARALRRGDRAKAEAVIAAGASVGYRDENGYDALLDAVHGRDIGRDTGLLDLLAFLLERGAPLDGCSRYGESALLELSRVGRFDAVQLLLHAGADEAPLGWTPLLRAVAVGSRADVERALDGGAPTEDRDSWQRTPWLLAIQTGDIARADALHRRGVDVRVRGRCGQPPLAYALEADRADMLAWLLDLGLDSAEANDFGVTPLRAAAELEATSGREACVQSPRTPEARSSAASASRPTQRTSRSPKRRVSGRAASAVTRTLRPPG
jgi:ankyrin repeat protein